jgi:hypothetical protein
MEVSNDEMSPSALRISQLARRPTAAMLGDPH